VEPLPRRCRSTSGGDGVENSACRRAAIFSAAAAIVVVDGASVDLTQRRRDASRLLLRERVLFIALRSLRRCDALLFARRALNDAALPPPAWLKRDKRAYRCVLSRRMRSRSSRVFMLAFFFWFARRLVSLPFIGAEEDEEEG
jgi:hypothetical protein